jgi:hypothetical protein
VRGSIVSGVLAVSLASCAAPPTELIVVVDTDLAIPAVIDAIEVEVGGPRGARETERAPLSSRAALPLTLGVSPAGDRLGPIEVIATARRGASEVLRRRHSVTLLRGETRTLVIHLVAACRSEACAADRTCGEEGCTDIAIDARALPEWTGTAPRLSPGDASMHLDGGARSDGGPPRDAAGDARSGAADASADACPIARSRCGGGACVDLESDLANCGACGAVCELAGGSETCSGGDCAVASCDPGRGDCNAIPSDGCEAACAAGSACTTVCGTTGSLDCASVCAPACAPPPETCNARDDDCDGGCEAGIPGCRRGVHRSVSLATGHRLYSTDPGEAVCCGYSIEAYDHFFVYAAETPGLVPLYRCTLAGGGHLVTRDPGCEGASGAALEHILGWVAAGPVCGASALHRLRSGDRFLWTSSAAERDSAIGTGWISEGVTADIWLGP